MGSTDNTPDCGMPDPEKLKQHDWLQQLVGEWTFEGECPAEPGKEPMTFDGRESVRAVGDVWIVAEGHGPMPDGDEATMITTLGYDPLKGRFVGTWLGTMMNHLWVYDGELDADERVLTLNAAGPAVDAQGKPTDTPPAFKDVIEIKGPDERVLTGHMLGEDGQWQLLMTARYRRKK